MGDEFQRAVLRELDQIRKGFEETVRRLEKHDETRDEEVSELKLQVGLLRGECQRNLRRDAGLVIGPSTIVAALNWWLQPPMPPASPVSRNVPAEIAKP